MKRVTAVLMCSVVILSGLTATASPAGVQPFVSARFSCTTTLAVWPGSGSATCRGEITGVGILRGSPVACVLACDFLAAIDSYGETCVGNGPPVVGSYEGEMFVNGVSIGTFNWVRVGTTLHFVLPGTVRGEGVFIPAPPIPTCAAPGPVTVNIHGRIHAI